MIIQSQQREKAQFRKGKFMAKKAKNNKAALQLPLIGGGGEI